MTQQFKFGDLVLWGINPSPFVFMGVSKIAPDLAWIRADNDLPHHAPFDELKPVPHTKPIPHPDTVRLDWLADRDQHIGNVQLPAECVEQHLDSMRDAIDMAMQMQPENAEIQEMAVRQDGTGGHTGLHF